MCQLWKDVPAVEGCASCGRIQKSQKDQTGPTLWVELEGVPSLSLFQVPSGVAEEHHTTCPAIMIHGYTW